MPTVIGGEERPATVYVPADYDPAKAWPLVVLLHGYGANGTVQNAYMGISSRTTEDGFVLVVPNGTLDAEGNRFWNATDFCCDFLQTGVDDVSYLLGLLAEAKEKLSIDNARVYFMGHSNGGFMSYRMACEASDQITGIASMAGASYLDWEQCAATNPVSVLQVHGTKDNTISYQGGFNAQFQIGFPGAQESAEMWASHDGCADAPEALEPFDLDGEKPGEETAVQRWTSCDPGAEVQLWSMNGSGHIPSFVPGEFAKRVLAFLLSQKAQGD